MQLTKHVVHDRVYLLVLRFLRVLHAFFCTKDAVSSVAAAQVTRAMEHAVLGQRASTSCVRRFTHLLFALNIMLAAQQVHGKNTSNICDGTCGFG